jgi:hypothetical protein
MASGELLQMDQAKFADKIILRHDRQRGEDSGMDRDQCLGACSDYQKGIACRSEPQRHFANSQPDAFRENPYFSSSE